VAATTAWCARLGIMPEGLVLGRRSLEDVFLEIAARQSGAAEVIGVVGA
jgi:ABC-2 type transport system ATP-binding protein